MMKPCPICKKEATKPHLPFCSSRCKQVDLGHWVTEAYTVPGEPAQIENQEEA